MQDLVHLALVDARRLPGKHAEAAIPAGFVLIAASGVPHICSHAGAIPVAVMAPLKPLPGAANTRLKLPDEAVAL